MDDFVWHTDFNIVAYTSVIPAEATEVKYEDVKHTFHHGATACIAASLSMHLQMQCTSMASSERNELVVQAPCWRLSWPKWTDLRATGSQ